MLIKTEIIVVPLPNPVGFLYAERGERLTESAKTRMRLLNNNEAVNQIMIETDFPMDTTAK